MVIERVRYQQQVQLLLQILPLVNAENCFALKGGTAINLFIRDLPRLSIDIDLVYLPLEERATALANITLALDRIAEAIRATLKGASVTAVYQDKRDALRLLVDRDGVRVKVELSPVLRGTVYEPEQREVSEQVEDLFGYAEVLVVNMADLYAGKICAALDRQHPRDLFDIHLLLENEGLTEAIRKATLVYMISHQRPIAELLNPHRNAIAHLYQGEFIGMTEANLPLALLEDSRERLIRALHEGLTHNERKFLLTFKNKQPDWSLLGLEGIDRLPAVRWKLQNLQRMKPAVHLEAVEKLQDVLTMISEGRDS